jgi:hypothetical protein
LGFVVLHRVIFFEGSELLAEVTVGWLASFKRFSGFRYFRLKWQVCGIVRPKRQDNPRSLWASHNSIVGSALSACSSDFKRSGCSSEFLVALVFIIIF